MALLACTAEVQRVLLLEEAVEPLSISGLSLSHVPHPPVVPSAFLAVSSLQALTAADLNLVLYVCETVDTQQVFGQHPCPLSQPVLLSLIQQLSSDLGTRTELKLK